LLILILWFKYSVKLSKTQATLETSKQILLVFMVTCRCSDLSILDTLWMMLSSLICLLFQILLALSRMLMFSTQRITKLITKDWWKSCNQVTRLHSLKLPKLNSRRSEISLIKFLDKTSLSCLTTCTLLSIQKEVSLCGLNSSQTTSKYQT